MTSKPARVNLWEEGQHVNAEVVTKFLFFNQSYLSKVAHFFYRPRECNTLFTKYQKTGCHDGRKKYNRTSNVSWIDNSYQWTSGVRLNKCVSYVI